MIRHAHDTTMYHISELGDEERKYLFNRHSFSEYATEVENFERFNSAAMLRIAEQRDGITEPSIAYERVRAEPTKLHWMLGQGQCRFLKIDGRFILSSEDFGKVVNSGNAKRACKYCTADFLHR